MLQTRWSLPLLLVMLSPTQAAAAGSEPADAAATSYTIQTSRGAVARIGAFRIRRDPTLGAAIRVFGQPASRKPLGGDDACTVDWRRPRLRIVFANFGLAPAGEDACSDSVGNAQSFTARGRRFRTWEGLRVGHRSDTIIERHSSAEFVDGTWWLRRATSPFGDESDYGVVRAIVAGGRVIALRGWIGAAGE